MLVGYEIPDRDMMLKIEQVYKIAGKAIRTDNTPLFGPRRAVHSSPEASVTITTPRRPDDLGGILDEILETSLEPAVSPVDRLQQTDNSHHHFMTRSGVSQNGSSNQQRNRNTTGFGALNFSSQPASPVVQDQAVQYGDEMDWSPSGSQHRAFSNHNPFKVKNPNPRFNDTPLGFNQTPVDPKPGPFWYKVPPAPTNPAQRLRNPTQPVIRESPKQKQENFFSNPRKPLDLGGTLQTGQSSFTLRDAQFYAPGPRDDPRDGLSSMMGSFSISPDPEDRCLASGSNVKGTGLTANGAHLMTQRNNKERMAELVVLFGAFWAWVTALGTQESYGPTLALGALCACLIVSIRLTADLLVDAQVRHGSGPSILSLSWANLGYAQVIAALALVWKTWAASGQGVTCGVYGNALLGVMIAHQLWHVFS
jgi:hypothetical protein